MKWEKNNKVSEEGEVRRDVHSETTGGKETGGEKNMALGFIDLEKA